jgi:aminoglycoside phosphotransferase
MSADETQRLKADAERVLLEKERTLLKKKRLLHELRRQRWDKPFKAINPAEIDSATTEYGITRG